MAATAPRRRTRVPADPQNRPQRQPKRPKMYTNRHPRRPKKRSRTTSRQENGTKTISRPSKIGPKGPNPGLVSPLGHHLEGQIGTKTEQKTIQKRSEKSRANKNDPRRSWTRLGAILGRFGCSLGALETLQTLRLPMFRDHSLFRC